MDKKINQAGIITKIKKLYNPYFGGNMAKIRRKSPRKLLKCKLKENKVQIYACQKCF